MANKRTNRPTTRNKRRIATVKAEERLQRWTPWGETVKSYLDLYRCSYERFGHMMGVFHMWATADEKRVQDIVEFGALPTFPEGLAITYICGVGNAMLLLPRIATKEDPPDYISCKSRYWDYLDIVPENRGLPPIGWEDMKPVREVKPDVPPGETLADMVLSDTTADLDAIFGPPVDVEPERNPYKQWPYFCIPSQGQTAGGGENRNS